MAHPGDGAPARRSRRGAGRGRRREFGARPLRRTIQSELDNRLSNMLLDGALNPGDTVVCGTQDGELVCTVDGPEG
ncbi:hypothetical protein ACFYPZ_34250 [Streptomyces sp. NPDC005506]|uniref:hypothetical protein n=1 Tax=unclassified Streptomyces TaxID=2593676 RepID=UPI0036816531